MNPFTLTRMAKHAVVVPPSRRGCSSSDPVMSCPWEKFQNVAGVSTASWNWCCAVSIVFCENWDTLWTIFCLLRLCDPTVTAPSNPLLTHSDCVSQSNTTLAYAAMQNLPADWWHATEIQMKRSMRWWSVQTIYFLYIYFSFWFFLLGGPSTSKLLPCVSRIVFKRWKKTLVNSSKVIFFFKLSTALAFTAVIWYHLKISQQPIEMMLKGPWNVLFVTVFWQRTAADTKKLMAFMPSTKGHSKRRVFITLKGLEKLLVLAYSIMFSPSLARCCGLLINLSDMEWSHSSSGP